MRLSYETISEMVAALVGETYRKLPSRNKQNYIQCTKVITVHSLYDASVLTQMIGESASISLPLICFQCPNRFVKYAIDEIWILWYQQAPFFRSIRNLGRAVCPQFTTLIYKRVLQRKFLSIAQNISKLRPYSHKY